MSEHKGPNSYELTRLATELALKGEDGFDTDEGIAAWQLELDNYFALAENKFAACAAVVRRAEADAGFLREEAKRFANAAAKLDAVAARVTERTLSLLQAHEAATGQSKVTFDGTAWVKIARRNSVQTIVETDAELLDFKFQRVTIAADKVKIKEALQAGEIVSGCSLLAVVSESVSFSK